MKFWERRPSCSAVTLNVFTKQFASLLRVGVPIDIALDSLATGDGTVLFDDVCPQLARYIQSGRTCSDAMSRYPGCFPYSYVALIRAAEASGQVVEALDRLSVWLDASNHTMRKVKAALTYPAFVVVLSGILTLILFQTVIPGILDTLRGLGVEMPLPTRILSGVVAAISQPLLWVAVIGLIGGLIYYFSQPEGQVILHEMAAELPIVRPVFIGTCACRYAATLAMMCETGVDLVQGAMISAQSSGSLLLKRDSDRVRRLLLEGKTLSYSLRNQPLYPHVLYHLVQVAEETGKFSDLLKQAQRILEDDASHRLDRLTAMMEPLILGALSVGVGGVLIAILMPLVNLTASL